MENKGREARALGKDGALTAEYGPYTPSLEVMLRHVHAALEAIIALAP